jgi:hypothetical protein
LLVVRKMALAALAIAMLVVSVAAVPSVRRCCCKLSASRRNHHVAIPHRDRSDRNQLEPRLAVERQQDEP